MIFSKKRNTDPEPNDSWRGIRQNARKKKLTPSARKRGRKIFLRSVLGVACTLLVFALLAGSWYIVREGARQVATTFESPVVRQVHFQTDGYLTQEWLEEMLALPEDMPLFSINLGEVREILEREGQVKRVVIARLPPDQIAIRVEERFPVLNLRARDRDGSRLRLVVGEDGQVYQGYGYPSAKLTALPHVEVRQLTRTDHGFGQLPGFPMVTDFLHLAREIAPELYHSWRVVSLRHLPMIEVRSDEVASVKFNSGNFGEQLERLQNIVAVMRTADYHQLDVVDLTFDNVPVRPAQR